MNRKEKLLFDKIIYSGFQAILTVEGISCFKRDRNPWMIAVTIFLFGFYYIISNYERKKCKNNIQLRQYVGKFIGGMFSLFSVLGYTITQAHVLSVLFVDGISIFRLLVGLLGYYIFFSKLMTTILIGMGSTVRDNFNLIYRIHFEKSIWGGKCFSRLKDIYQYYSTALKNYPFRVSFISLCILYTPYLVISYPGIFMGDAVSILCQGNGYEPFTSHHPVIYNLFLNLCVKIGLRIFKSWNIGLFVYSMLQFLFVVSVMSYGIYVLAKKTSIHVTWLIILLVHFVLNPRISNYMFLVSKDVIYSSFVFLFIINLFVVIKKDWDATRYFLIGFSLIGMTSFRNDGFIVAILGLVIFIFIDKKSLKKYLTYLVIVISMSSIINNVTISHMGIEPGSKREMLSVPLQMTARCAWEIPQKITQEEEIAILNAFSFNSLEEMGNAYNPNNSDNIKFRFTYDIFTPETIKYYKTWLKMGLKHPFIYLSSFIASYYQYFYPDELFANYSYQWSENCFDDLNSKIGSDLHYSKSLNFLRQAMEAFREDIFSYQLLSIFNTAGFWTWIFIVYASIIFCTLDSKKCMLIIPSIIILLICLASPCNGYYGRYQYPILIHLPWIILAN